MAEIIRILKLVKNIILNSKKVATTKLLGEYDMKTMHFCIVFISVVNSILIYYLSNRTSQKALVSLLIIFLMSISINILNLVLIYVYKSIINVISEDYIPYNFFKKIIMPYILTFLVLSCIVIVINHYLASLKQITSVLIVLWFNIQIFYVVKFRVNRKEIKKKIVFDIMKKVILYSLIIGVFILLNYYMQKPKYREKMNNLTVKSYENPIIRKDVYEMCKDIFYEVDNLMKNGERISKDRKKELNEITNTITFKINALRTNEINLIGAINTMVESSMMWYEAKVEDDMDAMESELSIYNIAVEKAKDLMEYYKE